MKTGKRGNHSTFNIQHPAHKVGGWQRRSTLYVFAILLLTVLCATGSQSTAEVSTGFEQGNKLYEEGNYRDAAEAYGKVIATGSQSPALFFNLGNARFKSGCVGEAITAYRQAERLAPRDPDIRANLEFARKQVAAPTLQMNWLRRQIETLTINEWTLLAMVPVWAWFALMIAARIKPALSRRLRAGTTMIGAAALVACGTLAFVLHYHFNERMVVVTARNAVVRYGPLTESQSAFTAVDGAELALLDRKEDWFQVSAGLKRTGWIKTNAVAILP